MARLNIKDGQLIVEGFDKSKIFNWKHRLFFTTLLGYRFDDNKKVYVFDEFPQLFDILRETINYLSGIGEEFETDKSLEVILQKILVEDEGYRVALENGLKAKTKIMDFDPPQNLTRQLRQFQSQGVSHLLTVRHGANFSVPGSGKTTTIYAAYEILRVDGFVDKLFVIGPRSCFFPWEDEYYACFGRHPKSGRLSGPKVTRYSIYLQSDNFDIFLCTYQTATNDVNEIIDLCNKYKVFLVLDESHNIKRLKGGVWSEAMLQIAPFATRRVILSGTPMPNSYSDLWTQLTFLWPGKQILGDRYAYQIRSEDANEHPVIREHIQPFFYRVGKQDLNLPPVTTNKVDCELNPYQASIYNALSAKFLGEVDALPEERHVLREWRKARIVRLIQAASNPTLLAKYSEEFDVPPIEATATSIIQLIDEYPKYEIPSKIEKATEIIQYLLNEGEKVVLWTVFVHNISMLQHLLEGEDCFVLYGAVPKDESEDIEFNREQQIRDFKDLNRPAVLIANPAACAESISLHKSCHHAIYLDRSFNCGQFMQSLDRIHRIGLEKDEEVFYHLLMASNTIDETIDRRLTEKQIAMELLLGDDIEVGTYDVDLHQMASTLDEEENDFLETLKDIRKQRN